MGQREIPKYTVTHCEKLVYGNCPETKTSQPSKQMLLSQASDLEIYRSVLQSVGHSQSEFQVLSIMKFISTKYFLLNLFSQDMRVLKQAKCSRGNSTSAHACFFTVRMVDRAQSTSLRDQHSSLQWGREHSGAKASRESYNPT